MNQTNSNNGTGDSQSLSTELAAESERLRVLAERLKAREEALNEMERNYPYFKEFVYRHLREEAERTLPVMTEEQWELERKDALPLEAFIDDLKKAAGVE